jgi:hypothetical protein
MQTTRKILNKRNNQIPKEAVYKTPTHDRVILKA